MSADTPTIGPGDIDRTTEREQTPLMDRCATTIGVAHELADLHALIVDRKLLPSGELAERFSLLMGIAIGTLWRLDGELADARSGR